MSRFPWLFALLLLTGPIWAPVDGFAGSAEAAEAAEAEGGQESHGTPLLPKVINTLLFFGILGWFAGPWIVAQLRTRRATIESDLTAAQRAREEAEAQLARMDERLAEVDREVAGILERAAAQAEAERQRILAAATQEAARLLASAEVQAHELEKQALRRLREQAADRAIDLARDIVRKQLGDQDRAKLFDQYLSGLEKAAG